MSNRETQQIQLDELSKGLFDEEQRRQHERDYTLLLNRYTKYQVNTLETKCRYRFAFFILCACLLLFPIGFLAVVYQGIHYGWVASDSYVTITTMVAAAFGLIADVAFLPKTMGEYFFNKEEDKNITQLFVNAQKNDQLNDKKANDRQEVLDLLKGINNEVC